MLSIIFVYPSGKLVIPNLYRYQRLAADDGGLSRFVSPGFVLDALDPGHPKPSLN
jgi:hypothetical protein